MKTLLIVTLPHAPFNAAVKDGTVGAKMQKILEAQKPEAAYFTELNGKRTGVLVVNLTDAAQISVPMRQGLPSPPRPLRPISSERRHFCRLSLNVRPMAIASPTLFICVVSVGSACGNFSKAKRGT
jgi:hypothetical protein